MMEHTATPTMPVNRLVSVDGGATASYAYDRSNQRYRKTTGGATTHYIWRASQVIAEHSGALERYWWIMSTRQPNDREGRERSDSVFAD